MNRLLKVLFLTFSAGALLPSLACASTWTVITRGIGEPAIVFNAGDIRENRIPARIQERNLAPVFASQVVLACLAIPSQPDDLLVYLPGSRRCMPYEQLPRVSKDLRSAVVGPIESPVTSSANLSDQSEGGETLILHPAASVGVTAGICVCPGTPPPNHAPDAVIQSGSPQKALAGSAIATITFHATDSDNDSISHSFSHTLDGGASSPGLPAGLAESCTPGSGILSCEISGSAPATIGAYGIMFTASDGSASDSVTATLTVIPEIVFKDGFEEAQ